MGRTTSEQKKTDWIRIRIKPDLKELIKTSKESSWDRDSDEYIFSAKMVRLGLAVHKEAEKILTKKIEEIALLPGLAREGSGEQHRLTK